MATGGMWDYQAVEPGGVPEPDEATLQTASQLTLLVKSRCSISKAMRVSVTRETYALSLAFKRCMHDRFPTHF